MNSGIYEIRNVVNGHRYIGSAIDIDKRFERHIKNLRRSTHYNKHLQAAWNKYGEQSFSFSALELCPKEQLYYIEQEFIDDFCPEYNKNTVAKGGGGTKGRRLSNEHKNKIRIGNTGKKMSVEAIKKFISKVTGRKNTPETILKMSLAHKGLPSPNKGRKMSEQQKKKISRSRKRTEKNKKLLYRTI